MKRVLLLLLSVLLSVSAAACGAGPAPFATACGPLSAVDSGQVLSEAAEGGRASDTLNGTSPSAPGSSEASATPGKPALSVAYRDDGRGEDSTLWKWVLAAYERHPRKETFTLQLSPIVASEGDYFAKIALLLQSDQLAPDVVTEDTFQLATDVEAGYLTVLDPYVAEDEDWAAGVYYPSLIEGVRGLDGKIYGIPYSTDTRGLWYNRTLFRQVGLPDPWQPETWEDILDACYAIHRKLPDVVPFWCNSAVATGEATTMQTYLMLLHGTGERLREEESGKWIVSSQGILDTLTFLETIYRNDLGPPLPKVLNGQASYIAAREYLPQGKLVISMDGNWIAGNYLETGASPWPEHSEVLGFTAMPTQYGQEPFGVSTIGGWAWSIPAKADNKDLAMSFIQALMTPPLYTDAIIARGGLGSRQDLVREAAYMALPFVETAASFLPFGTFRPKDKRYPEISAHIQSMVESVVSGTSPADAMATYAVDVARTVGDDQVIRKSGF